MIGQQHSIPIFMNPLDPSNGNHSHHSPSDIPGFPWGYGSDALLATNDIRLTNTVNTTTGQWEKEEEGDDDEDEEDEDEEGYDEDEDEDEDDEDDDDDDDDDEEDEDDDDEDSDDEDSDDECSYVLYHEGKNGERVANHFHDSNEEEEEEGSEDYSTSDDDDDEDFMAEKMTISRLAQPLYPGKDIRVRIVSDREIAFTAVIQVKKTNDALMNGDEKGSEREAYVDLFDLVREERGRRGIIA